MATERGSGDAVKPVLLVHDRMCPLCEGWGIRTETIVEYVRSRRCTSCEGTGKVPRVFGDWRPYEPRKEES
jgi:DnaJ-class molecular chaperone